MGNGVPAVVDGTSHWNVFGESRWFHKSVVDEARCGVWQNVIYVADYLNQRIGVYRLVNTTAEDSFLDPAAARTH